MSGSNVVVVALGSVILSSLLLDSISCPAQEVITECICWGLILLGGRAYLSLNSISLQPFKKSGLGIVAFGVTLLCLSCSIEKIVWSTAPLLGVALIFVEKSGSTLPEQEDFETKDVAINSVWRKKTVYVCVYAAITTILMIQGDPLYGLHLKLCWLFAQVVIYWGLFHRQTVSREINRTAILAESIQTTTDLAHYMVFLTAPLVLLWWQSIQISSVVTLVSVLKAVRWVAILHLVNENKISAPAWATIFTVCTNFVLINQQDLQSGLTVIGAFVALYRIASTFPQSTVGKWIVLVFALCPLWAFGVTSDLSTTSTYSASPTYSEYASEAIHPIKRLTDEASAKFARTQARQSKNLGEATTEYKKRYGRLPPPGFNDWYNFTVQNDVQWVDEYDYLTKSLEPFWAMSPKVLREYVDQALAIQGSSLNTLTVKNHVASLRTGSFQHGQILDLLKPVLPYLPDLTAALNELDEPRILIPHDKLDVKPLKNQDESQKTAQTMYFGVQDQQRIWQSVTASCAPDSRARSDVVEADPEHFWPPFISNLSASQDICNWPASASMKHGFLSSPSTFHYTHSRVPVLATAKISPFHDIMIPSSYYFQSDIAEYDESKDIPWEKKEDLVYWRGSGTGGQWSGGSWKMGHRQRFVNFSNAPDADILLLKEETPGKWAPFQTKMKQVLEKFKVSFSGFLQCDPADCQAQEEFFGKASFDHNGDAHQFKILYNLDGNSFSGRYYRFLKSNSLVFMQALFKEWHDDRVIPWVHFVPISLGMEELPEAARYLLSDPEGQKIAAKMAKESREWTRRVLRPIDLSAAYLRTFIEYARLLDDNRDQLSKIH